ncbi:hypothetical protein DL769_000550 [Monosporascus sp. CRB-8-3]|nr:hypothetical protein DL769_000550 [Monosporascus sp. CRB-8-3]
MTTGSADATAAEAPGQPVTAANGNGSAAAAAEAPEEENGGLEPGESFAVTEDGRFVLGAAFQVPSREDALRDAGNTSGMAWVADPTNGDVAVVVDDFVPLMSGGRSGEGAPAGVNNGVSSSGNGKNGDNGANGDDSNTSNSSQE